VPGRNHGWALLAAACCAACAPGGDTQRDADAVKLGEERAITRAAEMLESRPPAPAAETPPAPPVAEQRQGG